MLSPYWSGIWRVACLVIAQALWTAPVHARDWHVNLSHPEAADPPADQAPDPRTGTADRPLKSINAAATVAQPGDTVLVLIEGNLVRDNGAWGIWVDHGIEGARITRNVVLDNGCGIFLELSDDEGGRALVDNNIVGRSRNTGIYGGIYGHGDGIYTHLGNPLPALNPLPGPFQVLKPGRNVFAIWPVVPADSPPPADLIEVPERMIRM